MKANCTLHYLYSITAVQDVVLKYSSHESENDHGVKAFPSEVTSLWLCGKATDAGMDTIQQIHLIQSVQQVHLIQSVQQIH